MAKSPERMPKFYLTTAIDYSNGEPHLGHALEKIGADCIARYHRLRGDDVHFLMGMDEHSQSVIQAAARAGVTPDRKSTRLNSSHTVIYSLSLHDALPIFRSGCLSST